MIALMMILCLTLFLPGSVYADDLGVSVKCPSDIKSGEEFTCDLIGYSRYKVSSIEYYYSIPDNVEKLGFTINDIWNGSDEDNKLYLYTDTNQINIFKIGTFSLKANEDLEKINISTDYLVFGDSDFNEHVLVDNVNKEDSSNVKKKNMIKYGIIVLIIGILVYVVMKYRRKKHA